MLLHPCVERSSRRLSTPFKICRMVNLSDLTLSSAGIRRVLSNGAGMLVCVRELSVIVFVTVTPI